MQLCARTFGITVDELLGPTGNCLRAAALVYEQAPVRELSVDDEPSSWAQQGSGT